MDINAIALYGLKRTIAQYFQFWLDNLIAQYLAKEQLRIFDCYQHTPTQTID